LPAAAAVIFAVVFAAVALTIDEPGLAWDEANDIRMATDAAGWFGALRNEGFRVFSRDSVEHYWWYEWKQHPPVTRLVFAAGHGLFRHFGEGEVFLKWRAFRLCGAAIYAALCAMVFYAGYRYCGGWAAGFASAGALAMMPRMFGHAHIVETDLLLVALYFAAGLAFLAGLESRRGAALFGVLAGLLPAVKFSGAFAVIPFFLYGLIFARRRGGWNLLFALLAAPVVFYLVQPMYWQSPAGSLLEYLRHFLSPETQSSIVIHYFGQDYVKSPPWSYPFVMAVLSVPVVILSAAAVGTAAVFIRRRRRPEMVFILFNALFMMVLFAPSRVAVYDGERLFMAVFPYWALLAGAGIDLVFGGKRPALKAVAVAVFIAIASAGIMQSRPLCLTYYNEIAGGLEGAEKKGLEVIYWGEALTPGYAEMINRKLPRGARLTTIGNYHGNLKFFKELGLLRRDLGFSGYGVGDRADFLLLFNRRGVLDPFSRRLADNGHPIIGVRHNGVLISGVYILKEGLRFYEKKETGKPGG